MARHLMKQIVTHLSLGVASICLGVVTIFAVGKHPQSEYQKLVAKLKAGDTSINLTELRTAYADSPQYGTLPDAHLEKEMFTAYNSKAYAKAITAANKVLNEDYMDFDAHTVLFHAYRNVHQDEKAKFHQAFVKGLLGSILNSGTGKTMKSAYVVDSVEEEYLILHMKGLQPSQQSLIYTKHHAYDELVTINPKTRKSVTLYFNIDRPMGIWKKVLQKK